MTDKSNNDVLAYYAHFFKAWQVKLLGEKPTAEMLLSIHRLGARHGKQCLASAMTLRPNGVTAKQIIIACGAPQNNKRQGFIDDGLLRRIPMPYTAENHTVYRCEITPKGLKRIEAATKRELDLIERGKVSAGEADKALAKVVSEHNGKRKADKAKAAKAAKAKAKRAENKAAKAASKPAGELKPDQASPTSPVENNAPQAAPKPDETNSKPDENQA